MEYPTTIIETCKSETFGDDEGDNTMVNLGNRINSSVKMPPNPQSLVVEPDENGEDKPYGLKVLEKSQKDVESKGRNTEKRIEEFDLGRLLGSKFQQKYMQ